MNKRSIVGVVIILLVIVAMGAARLLLAASPDTGHGALSAAIGESQITPLLIAQENGEDQAGSGVPEISFTEMSYDFGTIPQSGSVSHTFVFRNTGDGQLKIVKAKGSWGCTAAVLTEDDIPPGGEGKIEVTFKPGKKKGNQKKTITVTSNDPANPTVRLTITALVEVAFDFDPSFINVGEISKADSVVEHAYLAIKHPEKMKIAEVTTSSRFVSAQQVDESGSEENPGRIEFLVKVAPGLPEGRINEIVTARSDDASLPAATLKIIGKRIGDVTVTPEMLHFRFNGSAGPSEPGAQDVEIVNRSGSGKLNVLGVEDPDDRLEFDLKAVEDGVRYTLAVRPKPQVLAKKGGVRGSIIIRTDSPEDKEITMRYFILVQ